MSAPEKSALVDLIDAAVEQLALVEGVLCEARDLGERIRHALQALENARGELGQAKQAVTVEGAAG